MYHKIIIAGYLGRDPEMRYTPDGTPVTSFSVAAGRKYTRPDGSQADETIWFRVTAWRRQAETCNQYLRKGSAVLVEGRLRADERGNPRIYTRNDGTAGASFEVTATDIKFLPSGGRGEAPAAEAGAGFEEIPPEEEAEPAIPF